MSTYCRRDESLNPATPHPRLVDSAEAALNVIYLAAGDPQRAEVIALLLEPDLCGHTIVVIDGATSPDAVIEVLELIGEAAAEAGHEQAFVLASVRPGVGPLPGDVDRWLELNEMADTFGCELLEWFVLSDGVAWCPRDYLAEPPRWPTSW